MGNVKHTPLLLMDNSSMYIVSEGEYKVERCSFHEAKTIIEMFDKDDIVRCYTDRALDTVLYDYIGIEHREFPYKKFHTMRPGQTGIIFKQYITKSETQPVVEPEPGIQSKKIENIYIYCEYITRMK